MENAQRATSGPGVGRMGAVYTDAQMERVQALIDGGASQRAACAEGGVSRAAFHRWKGRQNSPPPPPSPGEVNET